mgnify:CR=1 FL=1
MNTTQPLYRVPNGDWIDLVSVFGIVTEDQSKDFPNIKPRVNVSSSTCRSTVQFDTLEAARSWADEFAGLVNKARTANVAETGAALETHA